MHRTNDKLIVESRQQGRTQRISVSFTDAHTRITQCPYINHVLTYEVHWCVSCPDSLYDFDS
jgi:hypothetical protein